MSVEDFAIVQTALNDLGQWVADQQAMRDDGWKSVRDEGSAALARIAARLAEVEGKTQASRAARLRIARLERLIGIQADKLQTQHHGLLALRRERDDLWKEVKVGRSQGWRYPTPDFALAPLLQDDVEGDGA